MNFSSEFFLMRPRDALLQTPLFSVTVVTDTFNPKPSTVTQTCISNTSKKTRKCQMNKLVQRMSNPSQIFAFPKARLHDKKFRFRLVKKGVRCSQFCAGKTCWYHVFLAGYGPMFCLFDCFFFSFGAIDVY